MGNASAINAIRLSDDGQTSVVVPLSSPVGVSYTAESFASATTCRTVTKLCDPRYDYGGCTACQQWTYDCTVPKAGLQMSGNFNGDDFSTSNIMQIFYNDSGKSQNLSIYPTSTDDGQFWTALVFQLLQIEPTDTGSIDNNTLAYDENKDLITNTYGVVYGILSCNTTVSRATYTSDINGNIHNITTTPVNVTTGSAFTQTLGRGFGDTTLDNGLTTAAASALTSTDLAYRYARLLDRTTLSLTAGILLKSQPLTASHLSTSQAAKVPIPEFVSLIALNLILSVLGLFLCIQAYLLSLRQGVTDIQARLGLGAMVAGLFEDERLNESARCVEDLYAEFRGLPTEKVLAVDPGRGGRMRVFVGVGGVGGGTGKMGGGGIVYDRSEEMIGGRY